MATEEWYARDGLRFKCTQCGNCCTGPPGYVWFDDDEAKQIAETLGLSVAAFRREYAHKAYGRWTLNEVRSADGYDCVFLERDSLGKALCSIYDARPRQCRTWPFWKENLTSSRAWQRMQKNCPGSGHGKLVPVQQIRILRDSTPDL
jgi:Fe-S-cluster containining protein